TGDHLAAIEVFDAALRTAPLSSDALAWCARLVENWEAQHDTLKASQARDALIDSVAEDGAWYRAHRSDSVVIASTQALVRKALYASAIFHHHQAQKADPENARIEFAQAAHRY